MEIASAAWAQWAGGCGTCLKEMGNPARGEVTTTAVPLVCEPAARRLSVLLRVRLAFGKGGSAPDQVGCLGEQFVFLDSMLGEPGSGAVRLRASRPFPKNLRMAGGRVCGRPGSGVLEAPVVQPNPAGSRTTGCL